MPLRKLLTITRILGLKVASRLGIFLGRIIIACQRKPKIDLHSLETIYLNRSDRLGDAIISKEWIRLFALYLRSIGVTAEIRVLASSYNHSILSDLADPADRLFVDTEDKVIPEYESRLTTMIARHIGFLLEWLRAKWGNTTPKNRKILYIELAGGGWVETILKYKTQLNPIMAGGNIFWSSYLFDHSLSHSYIHYTEKNLVESYIEIVEWLFRQRWEFRSFVYDRIGAFYDCHPERQIHDIALCIGVKDFRNFTRNTWSRLIRHTAQTFPDRQVVVIDDHLNLLYEELKNEKFPPNVELKKNTLKLTEFVNYMSTFRFVVGVDGGGINMIRTLTNSLTLYTFAQSEVWSPFVGPHRYHESRGEHGWRLHTAEISAHQRVSYLHKDSFWLPTFNITGNRELFDDIDLELFVGVIGEGLKKRW